VAARGCRSPPSSIAACGFDFAAASIPAPDRPPRALHSERLRHVVLGRERVRRRELDLGPAGLERAHEVRRLSGHVQARRDRQPVERLLLRKALADRRDDRHLAGRPLDAS
jgi:hypothetical protein